MTSYYIEQDSQRCIGCYACEVHCKSKNNLPVGPRFCRIAQDGPKNVGGRLQIAFTFTPCFHCLEPQCVAVCPSGAMRKRAEDGIVVVDRESCIGCQACLEACPWRVPQWDEENNKAIKCDYCLDRIAQGLRPACVTKCTAHALRWVSGEEAERLRRARLAQG